MLFTDLCPASNTACHAPLFSMKDLDASKMTWKRADFDEADPIPQKMFMVATQKVSSQQGTGDLEHLFLTQGLLPTEDTEIKTPRSDQEHIPVLQAHILQSSICYTGKSERWWFCSQLGTWYISLHHRREDKAERHALLGKFLSCLDPLEDLQRN